MKPIFVKIKDYKELLDIIDVIKTRIVKAKQTMGQITALKEKEDMELEAWEQNLDDVSKKVDEISRALFESKM